MPVKSKNKLFPSLKEDFRLMDSLIYLADTHNLKIMSYNQPRTSDEWFVVYLDLSKEKEPILEHCRDEQDYHIRMDNWIKNISVYSPKYPKFQDMVIGEIERLKNV